ncbi:outer membrane protein assembly factor BamA [Thiohalospira sp.]|uniref:outer membrane protein assembly factor BamA n=1 Tax=Thiohalospira sp. TaxID=3080549 RepID=UPI00398087E2
METIELEGLQRVSPGSVLDDLPVSEGEELDAGLAATAVRELFATGYFHDVRLERDGGTLIVQVSERPSIASLSIEGNEDIRDEDLEKNLEMIGLVEGRIFDRSVLDRMEQELERQYFANGKYGVAIDTTVEPKARNRVGITIDIREGDVARIQGLNVTGNRAYDESELLEEFKLGPRGPLQLFSGKDRYSQQRLTGDLESLRSHYLDRGYVDFSVTSSQVSLTPDLEDVYVDINVEEGQQFTVSDTELEGRFPIPKEELEELVAIEAGEVFSRSRVTRTSERITERLAEEGFAFANVNPEPSFDRENREVGVTFRVEPGKRVYVRRIDITGNTKTKDRVIRREIRQMERALLLPSRVDLSRRRLNRLGFFEEVDIETQRVSGTDDQVDLKVSVNEQPSGSLSAGVGYSESQGALVNASVSQQNFLGTGTHNSLTINNSEVSTVYDFSYTNPYYTKDGVSRSFNGFYRSTDAGEAYIASYITDSYGGGMSYSFPQGETSNLRLGLDYKHTDLKATSNSPNEIFDFQDEYGERYENFLVSTGWNYDSRNQGVFPTEGGRLQSSLKTALPGSELEYFKAKLRPRYWLPLFDESTLALDMEVNYGDGYGGTEDLPIFENYYGGGTGSVRGFRSNSLGPRATGEGIDRSIGGAFEVNGTLEYLFPPGGSESLRLGLFVDAGNVWEDVQAFEPADFRASYGAGVVWLTPMGILELSYAKPLAQKSGDELDAIQFNIGTPY